MQKQVENVEHDDDYHIDQNHRDDNNKNDHSVLMMIMMMIMATQEGCKSTVVGSRLGQFQLHRRRSIVPQWKAIVTWAELIVWDRITWSWLSRVNCIWPDCDMMRLCRWWTSTGSSRWAQFRNATKMCSLMFPELLSPILLCFKKWTCLTKYAIIFYKIFLQISVDYYFTPFRVYIPKKALS